MKDILSEVLKFAWEALKEVDWKKVGYKFYTEVLKAKLEALVKDSNSKWDDVMLAGVNQLVEKFLKPGA